MSVKTARTPTEALRQGSVTAMTARLAARQFGLLFLAATALLAMTFFINFYNVLTFEQLWAPMISFKYVTLPALLVAVYGYVFLCGILFALGPSEKGFNFFFAAMVFALLVVNYDHSIIDWFLTLFASARARQFNPVSAFKILFAGLFLLVVIMMHYNVLSDDFARRMLRRGVPTDEVARIRPGMFKVLVPTVLTAGAIAFGLAVLGEFSAFIFQDHGLLPKVQLILLAALIAPMGFLIRGILRDLAAERKPNPPAGPNR